MEPEDFYQTEQFKALPPLKKFKVRVKLTLIAYLMTW